MSWDFDEFLKWYEELPEKDPYIDEAGNLLGNFAPPEVDVAAAQRRIQEGQMRERQDELLREEVRAKERTAHDLRIAMLAPQVGSFLSLMVEHRNPGTVFFHEARRRGWFMVLDCFPDIGDWPGPQVPICLTTDGELFYADRYVKGQIGADKYGDGGCATSRRFPLSRATGEFRAIQPGTTTSIFMRKSDVGGKKSIEAAFAEGIAAICDQHGLLWPGVRADWRQRRGKPRTGWQRKLRGPAPQERWPWNCPFEEVPRRKHGPETASQLARRMR